MPQARSDTDHKLFSVLVLCGFLLALAARTWGGYPNCASDEHNWVFISHEVARGVNWPISGPWHFGWVQKLASTQGLAHERAMAMMGLFSVPVLLLVMGYAYHLQGVCRPGSLVLVLCTSTYFLAPLFESRPQQWGQVLVLLGVTLGWRAINGLGAWWPYALVLVLTAGVHILSFAILVACSLIFWSLLYGLQKSTPPVAFRMASCLLAGLVLFFLPEGPYASMVDDVSRHHWRGVKTLDASAVVWGLVVVGLAGAVLLLRQQLFRRLASAALASLDKHPAAVVSALGFLALALLVLQAGMLPAEAWSPYGGSILLFGISQSGNLFFIGLLAWGLVAARKSYLQGRDQALIHTHTVLLLAMGVITVAALLVSYWTLHTNWLLRVLNYGTLFMAPFAAMGLSQIKNRSVQWTLLLLMMTISLVSVVRPPAVFNCSI